MSNQAMALAALKIKDRDPERWNAFVQSVAGLVYDRIHADCEPTGCVCEEGRSGIKN